MKLEFRRVCHGMIVSEVTGIDYAKVKVFEKITKYLSEHKEIPVCDIRIREKEIERQELGVYGLCYSIPQKFEKYQMECWRLLREDHKYSIDIPEEIHFKMAIDGWVCPKCDHIHGAYPDYGCVNCGWIPLQKTIDETPILKYKGRKIEITSGGAYHNTFVSIDGKRIDHVRKLALHVLPNEIVTVEMEIFDV